MSWKILLIGCTLCWGKTAFAPTYNIVDYKAVADGKTVNTKAIQQAIDDCAAHGGG
jgi:polygalacturonase